MITFREKRIAKKELEIKKNKEELEKLKQKYKNVKESSKNKNVNFLRRTKRTTKITFDALGKVWKVTYKENHI